MNQLLKITLDIYSQRSYFGGLLCVCWSPDSKYLVFGGEDDLVSVYSFEEKRVVVRGQGHKSWVSVVAFDQYNIAYGELPDGLDFSGNLLNHVCFAWKFVFKVMVGG